MKSTKNCEVYEDFFPPELLQKVLTHYDEVMGEDSNLRNVNDHVWEGGTGEINKPGKNTFYYVITKNIDDDIHGDLKDFFIKKFNQLPKSMWYYLYQQGSAIQWHSDAEKGGACTIYLQEKEWDIADGGLYMWQEQDGSIHGIMPTLNTAVRNDKLFHATTPTYDFSPVRKVLQVFFRE